MGDSKADQVPASPSHPLVQVASNILVRAVDLENQKKFSESLVCYQESIEIFLKALRTVSDVGLKNRLTQKTDEYMRRAEKVKETLKKEILSGNYHEQICISEGSMGYGYQRVFGRFLEDGMVSVVWVEDPYIRSSSQIENFSHFCEVLVRSNSKVKQLYLTTGPEKQNPNEQLSKFNLIKQDLLKHSISFEWKFSDSLHDREVRFDNGWIVKIGRGLDYIRRSEHKFCGLGVHDYDFRPCSATTIDIFNRSSLL